MGNLGSGSYRSSSANSSRSIPAARRMPARVPRLSARLPWTGTGDRIGDARMPEDMMAAPHPLHLPALLFEGGDDLLAVDRRELGAHAAWIATLPRWTVGMGRPSSCITSR